MGGAKPAEVVELFGEKREFVVVEGDLRVLFYIEGDSVKTLVVAIHDIYR